MTENEKVRIKQLRSEGLGYKKIAAEMNISVNTIKSFCRRENVYSGNTTEQTAEEKQGNQKKENRTESKRSDYTEVVSSTGQKSEEPNTTICPNCGAVIIQKNNGRKKRFCSDKCRVAYWNSHPEELNMKSKRDHVCKCCGKAFYNYRDDSKFCSIECYMKYRFGGVRHE